MSPPRLCQVEGSCAALFKGGVLVFNFVHRCAVSSSPVVSWGSGGFVQSVVSVPLDPNPLSKKYTPLQGLNSSALQLKQYWERRMMMERMTIAPLSDLFAAFSTKGLQNKHFSARSIFIFSVRSELHL